MDSSGELSVISGGNVKLASDVSEVARNSRRKRESNGSGKRENVSGGYSQLGSESGYGSEPWYRDDMELGYDDEVDEEEDDSRLLFWDAEFGGTFYCVTCTSAGIWNFHSLEILINSKV
ncbi:unnamed protein product [Fraxinus pennsylvanica]|uniref:Uncharacterized protein n=1 Tax=Fraxinus pennsylvanica TaxID=56036 RepID=A0AAD2DP02_9LAMI|nr:unnamed protein product [Fraxinus pennsylvanica]